MRTLLLPVVGLLLILLAQAGWCQPSERELNDRDIQLLLTLGNGQISEAEKAGLKLLEDAKKALGENHPLIGKVTYHLGWVYFSYGDRDGEAEAYLRAAIEHFRRTKAEAVDEASFAKGLLGSLFFRQKKFREAQTLLEQALVRVENQESSLAVQDVLALNDLVTIYQAQGTSAKAIKYYEGLLSKITLSPNDPSLASLKNSLGMLYSDVGRYREAETLLREALQAHAGRFGPHHTNTGIAKSNLAMLLTRHGRYVEALPLSESAYEIFLRAYGDEHRLTATMLSNLGLLQSKLANYSEAIPRLERAYRVRKNLLGTEHLDTISSLNNLGATLQNAGRLEESLTYLSQADTDSLRFLGKDHSARGTYLDNLAQTFAELGRFEEAEKAYMESLRIRQIQDNPTEVATALHNLGFFYENLGAFAKSEGYYQEAIRLTRGFSDGDEFAAVDHLKGLASLYREISDFQRADELYQKVYQLRLERLGPSHPDTARALGSIAGSKARKGHLKEAILDLETVLAVFEDRLGPKFPERLTILSNLADYHGRLRQYDKAENYEREALRLRKELFGPTHPDVASSWSGLGLIQTGQGRFKDSIESLKQAYDITLHNFGPKNSRSLRRRRNLAFAHIFGAEPKEALKLAREEAEGSPAVVEDVLAFTSGRQRLAFQKEFEPFSLPASLGDAELTAVAALRYKAIVLDSLLEDVKFAANAGPDVGRSLTRLSKLKEQRLAAARRGDSRNETELKRSIEALEGKLASGRVADGNRELLRVTPAEIRGALPPKSALIEFVRYRHCSSNSWYVPSYGAVIIGKSGNLAWVPLGPAEAIEKEIDNFCERVRSGTSGRVFAMSQSARTETLSPSLRELHNRLMSPILKVLPDDTETMVISPDGALAFVPFSCLVDDQSRFLAENFTTLLVSSGRDLLRSKSGPKTRRFECDIFGDPEYHPGQGEGRWFSRLSGTLAECQTLKTVAEGLGLEPHLYLGKAASEENVRKVRSPLVLHLATHGYFLEPEKSGTSPADSSANPMQGAGLVLSGAEQTLEALERGENTAHDNDGFLSAEEVASLDLSETWLVNLSACDTAQGRTINGEGVVGLQRGFAQAGASNVLMTLWPVADQETARFMTQFYRSALDRMEAPRSLAAVQKEWLVRLKAEKGIDDAVRLAGPFVLSFRGALR